VAQSTVDIMQRTSNSSFMATEDSKNLCVNNTTMKLMPCLVKRDPIQMFVKLNIEWIIIKDPHTKPITFSGLFKFLLSTA